MFLDSKLQKLTFLLILFHFVHHFYNENPHNAISSSLIIFLLCLQRCQNLIITGVVLVQVHLLESIIKHPLEEMQRQDKALKSSIKRDSIISRVVLIWFVHASFYYQVSIFSVNTYNTHSLQVD